MERIKGRKPRFGAGYSIKHAQELFRRSVDEGHPDFKYVALAIGEAPASPPSWAVLACIELRKRDERQTARGHSETINVILNEIVRFYIRAEREFIKGFNTYEAFDNYTPPTLRSAILSVLKERDPNTNADGANDDWHRDIREAWNREQIDCLLPSSDMQLEQGKPSVRAKRKLKTTIRIDNVLRQSVAEELGHPTDLQTWVWSTKRIIDEQNAIAQSF
jgi:hypothetical protein